jgi:hypothetical protein
VSLESGARGEGEGSRALVEEGCRLEVEGVGVLVLVLARGMVVVGRGGGARAADGEKRCS